MQKIELHRNLKLILDKTKSQDIIDYFDKNDKQQGGSADSLLNLIVESKAGFDQSLLNAEQNKIIEQFDGKKYFDTKYYSTILKFISQNNFDKPAAYLQRSKHLTDLFTFHSTLITTFNVIDNLLFQDNDLKDSIKIIDYKKAEEEGFLSFEIMSIENINLQQYSIVINNISKLINTIYEVESELQKLKFDGHPVLMLVDSGSNTMISIKLPKQISKSVAKIIDDVWKAITNPTGYKLDKIDENIGSAIGILQKINSSKKEGLITPEQAEKWRREITNSTKEIILNNTLTKSKSDEMYLTTNQKMLTEAKNRFLTDGKK